MYTITYVSTVSPDLSEDAIRVLLKESKESNMENSINGIFLYSEGNFLQVLEGDESAVKSLYSRIEMDDRHYNIIKLLDKKSNRSSFSEYSSSFTVIEDNRDIEKLYDFLRQEKKNNPENFKKISYITRKFLSLI